MFVYLAKKLKIVIDHQICLQLVFVLINCLMIIPRGFKWSWETHSMMLIRHHIFCVFKNSFSILKLESNLNKFVEFYELTVRLFLTFNKKKSSWQVLCLVCHYSFIIWIQRFVFRRLDAICIRLATVLCTHSSKKKLGSVPVCLY